MEMVRREAKKEGVLGMCFECACYLRRNLIFVRDRQFAFRSLAFLKVSLQHERNSYL
jgi:hypothetical protein